MLVYRLIIFDFDGTLADSRESIVDCLIETFKHFGDVPPLPERVTVNIGMGLEASIADLNPELAPDEIRERAIFYRNLYKTEGVAKVKAMPGADDLLDTLSSAGARMALLSNKNDAVLKACVGSLGWERFFGFVGGALEDGVSKPDPSFRIVDLKQAFPDIEASEILVIGDTDHDMIYARNMGVDSCLAVFGYGRSAKARIESPDFEIEELEEIKGIVI